MSDVASNVEAARERLERAATEAGRSASDVTLIAVTKTVSIERVALAVRAGVKHLGENRVQEVQAKFAVRGTLGTLGADGLDSAGVTLHMIGGLQRNKAREAAALFDCIQSVDRPQLVDALEKASAQERPGEPLPVLLQVNVTGEASKGGVSPAGLPRLADLLAGCEHLRGAGLMTIARLGAREAELRQTFATLRRLLEGLRQTHPGDWRHLSMGMSDDYEHAIKEGATMIRLGQAIFGARRQ